LTRNLSLFTAGLLVVVGCAEELPETPPRQLEGSPFHYPEDLWDAGQEGETILRLYVTEAGAVDSVRVEQASQYPAFDSAAVLGARDLRFEPARRGEEALGAWVLLPVQFDLPGGEGAKAPPAP
jgi:periplasmic protein TonB